ncbi:Serine carboxypeptidase 1 [Rhynchospora pubera]|uniref:Serine carboxypeptidase 1 n=1 Tax=Rhynchospora pubera TaxID=906938 RepID=A0AAV8CQD8_9POAL|nr:Serine carboxypeptidase 1 [Rhynchospora pubera]
MAFYSAQAPRKCLLYSLLFLLWQLVSAQNRINNLPGFQGPLPFTLETGYLEVDKEKGVEYFYYFIESEGNPEEDPLILWLTGGPGCTGFAGLVFEIGPLSFDLQKQKYEGGLPPLCCRPTSWTQVSSIIFVDWPAGVGFSYSHTLEGLQSSDTESVRQLLKFLQKWLGKHPNFNTNSLYIGGDSYSGMIIPVLAHEITIAKESHGAPFNLKGYLAGNPLTDENFESNGRVPFLHGMALISDELFESTKKICSGEYANPSNSHCAKYLDVVHKVTKDINEENILEPYFRTNSPRPGEIHSRTIGNGLYNEEVPLLSSGLPFDCRASPNVLSEMWANNDTVRDALGVRKGTVDVWKICRLEIPYTFDILSTVQYHLNVTKKGYPALIYSGDHDLEVTYVGTQAWIQSLNFSIVDDWRPWYVGGQVAGFTRRYSNNLTFATVKGAGHIAPQYKPKECQAMIVRWLSDAPL